MNNADKPINGIIRSETDGENRFIGVFTDYQDAGLTKREYASMLAMQGLITGRWACPDNVPNDPKTIAVEAVKYADELLKQLENK